jgi:hypothetical protein
MQSPGCIAESRRPPPALEHAAGHLIAKVGEARALVQETVGQSLELDGESIADPHPCPSPFQGEGSLTAVLVHVAVHVSRSRSY